MKKVKISALILIPFLLAMVLTTTNSYSRTRPTWATVVCTTTLPNGGTEISSACNKPDATGPCDVKKDCPASTPA